MFVSESDALCAVELEGDVLNKLIICIAAEDVTVCAEFCK